MRKWWRVVAVCLALFLPAWLLVGCTNRTPTTAWATVRSQETSQHLANPDIGFYKQIVLSLNPEGVGTITWDEDADLYNLCVDLGAFSKAVNGVADQPLTLKALDQLDNVLASFNMAQKNVVVRCTYDAMKGISNLEPNESMILQHIQQIAAILNKYQETITAIEIGMLGINGFYGSDFTWTTIRNIIRCFLNYTQNFPILITDTYLLCFCLEIDAKNLSFFKIWEHVPEYRLGFIYCIEDYALNEFAVKHDQYRWLEQQNTHLPSGMLYGWFSSIPPFETCLSEMQYYHSSYLGDDQSFRFVLNQWADEIYAGQTVYDYLHNHIGYRFLMRYAEIMEQEKQLTFRWQIENLGFANLTRKDVPAQIMLVKQDTQIVYRFDVPETAAFNGQGDYCFTIDASAVPNGRYEIYYCPCLAIRDGEPTYPIAFANQDMYSDVWRANRIGVWNF